MDYRIDKQRLLENLSIWNAFLKKKVCLIACGGTALTLLGIKSSTKDIDLMVPDETEHAYLIRILQDLGYKPASGWDGLKTINLSLTYLEASACIQQNYWIHPLNREVIS